MRIVTNLGAMPNLDFLQVEKTPDVGEAAVGNGRVFIPVPEGASFIYDDYLAEISPSTPDFDNLQTHLAGELLAQYPMYSNIFWNYLLHPSDLADLDLAYAGTFPGTAVSVRAQLGRGTATVGNSPNTTAILPQNGAVTPVRPGCIITDTVDLTAAPISIVGAQDYMVWWKVYSLNTTHDIMSDYGIHAGVNEPAIRQIIETDQEPAGLEVYISHDDGVSWTGPVGRLVPNDLGTVNSDVRLAFVNTGSTPIYLSAYAVLF